MFYDPGKLPCKQHALVALAVMLLSHQDMLFLDNLQFNLNATLFVREQQKDPARYQPAPHYCSSDPLLLW